MFRPLGSDPYDVINRQDRELVVAAERVRELTGALLKYGQHAADCRERLVPRQPCSCGYAAAIVGECSE
jgi:hypothetical protein